jgi:DNA-binding transcriptional regulator YiaG
LIFVDVRGVPREVRLIVKMRGVVFMQAKIALRKKVQMVLNPNSDSARIDSIKKLINELFRAERSPEFLKASPSNYDVLNKEFSTIFSHARKVLELDDETTSELIGISRPTIQRWENGESAPYFLAQPMVLKCIRKEAIRKLKTPNHRL